MPDLLTPSRRRSVEILDTPGLDPALAIRSLRDVSLANRLFGGTNAVLAELGYAFADTKPGDRVLWVDVGSGIGDIPLSARALAASRRIALTSIAVELEPALAKAARANAGVAVCANALALPFADNSVDVVTCSQVLHHFETDAADLVLREMTRVARRRVVVADLRRSWIAMAGLWLGSYLLRFHPVSRHDGLVSIRRGYTAPELSRLVVDATGRQPRVCLRFGFRVTASWTPRDAINSVPA